MKKYWMLGAGLCLAMMVTSCKTKESAYKKMYQESQQRELTQSQANSAVEVTPVETVPVAATPVVSTPVAATPSNVSVREEKVDVVTGNGIKNYSVVCGSFGMKENADKLTAYLIQEGYAAQIVFNPASKMYRVVVATYDDKATAAQARDAFKAKYPSRADFQGSWLLYRVY